MICVLLSTYNGEKYLEEQLESLRQQVNVEIKILIRDDGSKDHTAEIIQRWYNDNPQLIDLFVQGENVGFALSFIELLKIAMARYPNAEYYAFCDQDDVWLPNKLSEAVQKLKNESQEIPITYCSNTCLVDQDLQFLRMGWKQGEARLTKHRALIQSFATGCTMVFNHKAAEICISHLPKVIKVHDFLIYQICMFLGKVIYDENSYILYRQHGKNQIGKPDFWGRFRKRLEGHYKEHVLEYQNLMFLSAYKDLLNVEDIGLICRFVYYRKNLFAKLSLLFDSKIKYTSFERNYYYVLKIILGGV